MLVYRYQKYVGVLLLQLFFCIFSQLSVAQSTIKSKSFDNTEIGSYRIKSEIYNFWWSKVHKYKYFPTRDTLPYFVDDRDYKGVLNYGIEYKLKSREHTGFIENQEMYYLKVFFKKFDFDSSDSTVRIKGRIDGGWSKKYGRDFANKENSIHIFIGEGKDTTNLLYFEHFRNPKIFDNIYKGKVISSNIVLDTFPSFYLKNYTHSKTETNPGNQGKTREFEIASKINPNSIIVFGLDWCYAEIFEIGKMVFNTKKSYDLKVEKKRPPFKVIIKNNVQVKNKNPTKKHKYYDFTENAEELIIARRYGKAHQTYKKMFALYGFPFARDLHNAIRCAILARVYGDAVEWSKKLVLKGVTLSYFDSKIFNRVKNRNEWKSFISEYDSIHNVFKSKIDTSLIREIKRLVNKDKEIYQKNIHGEVGIDSLRKTSEHIDETFIGLIEEKGFPSEDIIGATVSTDGKSIVPSPPFSVLLIHSFKYGNKSYSNINRIITKASSNLKYDSFRSNLKIFHSEGNTCLKIYKGNLYNDKTCRRNESEISRVKFRFQNEYDFVINQGNFIVIPVENEKQDDKYIIENHDFIAKLTDDWFFYEN